MKYEPTDTVFELTKRCSDFEPELNRITRHPRGYGPRFAEVRPMIGCRKGLFCKNHSRHCNYYLDEHWSPARQLTND